MRNNYVCRQHLDAIAAHDKPANAFGNCIRVCDAKLHEFTIKVVSLPLSGFKPECSHGCDAAWQPGAMRGRAPRMFDGTMNMAALRGIGSIRCFGIVISC